MSDGSPRAALRLREQAPVEGEVRPLALYGTPDDHAHAIRRLCGPFCGKDPRQYPTQAAVAFEAILYCTGDRHPDALSAGARAALVRVGVFGDR